MKNKFCSTEFITLVDSDVFSSCAVFGMLVICYKWTCSFVVTVMGNHLEMEKHTVEEFKGLDSGMDLYVHLLKCLF